jgi:hypothetical protein
MKSSTDLYLAIARENYNRAIVQYEQHRKPLEGGRSVITPDPDQNSHKAALIAIVFSYAYIESLVYWRLAERYGHTTAGNLDNDALTKRLSRLDVPDHDGLYASCERLRLARVDVVHDQPGKPWTENYLPFIGLKEAEHGIVLATRIHDLLGDERPKS